MFFIDIKRRKVYLAGVTAHPVRPWVTQQARNLVATLEDQGRELRFLIRDRDDKFVGPFDEVIRSTGARVIKTPVQSPRANAFAERFVQTARAECLDWVLVRSERHTERVLREFVAHNNRERPYRGIDRLDYELKGARTSTRVLSSQFASLPAIMGRGLLARTSDCRSYSRPGTARRTRMLSSSSSTTRCAPLSASSVAASGTEKPTVPFGCLQPLPSSPPLGGFPGHVGYAAPLAPRRRMP